MKSTLFLAPRINQRRNHLMAEDSAALCGRATADDCFKPALMPNPKAAMCDACIHEFGKLIGEGGRASSNSIARIADTLDRIESLLKVMAAGGRVVLPGS